MKHRFCCMLHKIVTFLQAHPQATRLALLLLVGAVSLLVGPTPAHAEMQIFGD